MKTPYRTLLAPTGPSPMGIEVSRAEGAYIYDTGGKAYIDLVAGVSALPLGHRHPQVERAVKTQLERYWHVMVYGEFFQDISLQLARKMASLLPENLSMMYPVNSGTEATEAAIKLAKKFTGRPKIVAAKKSYHGNTQGSLSVMGYEPRKIPFAPLIPGVEFIGYNDEKDLEKIDRRTAAVILETIQGGAGFIEPQNDYLKKVKARCEATGSLLILDEIQTGFARTGKMFGFENYDVVPDILITGKALGGGFPFGAVSASPELFDTFIRPPMSHITTFGGHPVIAAAAKATLDVIEAENLGQKALADEQFLREKLKHPLIREIRGRGLMLALMMPDKQTADRLILTALQCGLILFWLLYEPRAVRLTPPLNIARADLEKAANIILEILDEIRRQ